MECVLRVRERDRGGGMEERGRGRKWREARTAVAHIPSRRSEGGRKRKSHD